MNGKIITCGDTVVSVTVLLLYTISLVLSVLYTVTLYPVISPLGWVGGLQEMTISTVCILVSGLKVNELSKVAAKLCTGPGSEVSNREIENIQGIYMYEARRGGGRGGREGRKEEKMLTSFR